MDEDLIVKSRKEGHVGSPTISGMLGFFGFHYSYVHAVEQKILPLGASSPPFPNFNQFSFIIICILGSKVTVMGPVVKGTRGLMVVNPSRSNQLLSPRPHPLFVSSRSEEDWYDFYFNSKLTVFSSNIVFRVHTVESKVFNFRVAGVALGLPGLALISHGLNLFNFQSSKDLS